VENWRREAKFHFALAHFSGGEISVYTHFSGGKTEYILIFPGRKMSMGEK
jgi:hypothetical protein